MANQFLISYQGQSLDLQVDKKREGTKCTASKSDTKWSEKFKTELDEDKGATPDNAESNIKTQPGLRFIFVHLQIMPQKRFR